MTGNVFMVVADPSCVLPHVYSWWVYTLPARNVAWFESVVF